MFDAEVQRTGRWRSVPTPAEVAAVEVPLAEVVGVLNAVTARLTDLVAEALRTGVWEQVGIRSPEHWLAWKAGVSGRRAKRLVAIARRRLELPVTVAAFDRGALSEDQVAEIARHVPAAHDDELAALASQATVAQVHRVVSRYRFDAPAPDHVDPPGEATPEDVTDRDQVSFGYGDDGRWSLRADLAPDLGALVERALLACRDAEHHDRHPDRDANAPAIGITWADALVRLGDACLTGLAGGRPAGDRHQVIVHIRADTPDARTYLHLGPSLPTAVRRLVGCDATVRHLLEDGTGVPLRLGRKQRAFSSAQRIIVEDRYGGRCARPGCERARGLHLHHHVHWEDGGASDVDNALPLCGRDHRLHHHGLLDIVGDPARPDTITFRDHHGRVLSRGAETILPDAWASPSELAGQLGLPPPTWRHPTGERLQTWAITFGEPGTAA